VAGAAAVVASLVAATAPSQAVVPGPTGRIVFESNRTGDPEIWVMNPDGSVPLNLTRAPKALDVYPAWSPDSSMITFSSDRHERGNLDVYKMDAFGANLVQLTDSPGEDRGTSWTSDGRKIVFHSARDRDEFHTFDVWIMDADGSNQQKLFVNGSAAYVCGDSVTGKIVFNSNRDGNFEIYTMNVDGTGLFQVTTTKAPRLNSGPKWSPDCSTISYNRTDAGGSLDVLRVNADGTNIVNLTNAPGVFDAFSAWSPAGDRIVFSSNRDVNFEIYTMDASDGGNVQRITFTDFGEADLRSDWGTYPPYYGPPFDRVHCADGVWAQFTVPTTFANQGKCVKYVEGRSR